MLAGLRQNRGSVALSIVVIGVTLALPIGLHVLQQNVIALTAGLGGDPEVTLFLEPSATRAVADSIAARFADDARVRGVAVIDKDEALAGFDDGTDMRAIVAALDVNPLPYAVVLTVADGVFEGAAGDVFRTELETLPAVDDALFDIVWIRRLEAFSRLVERAALIVALVIGTAVVLITGNTIRVGIEHRQDEIEVMKLVGATDAYVSRPFLYSGALQGLLGAILAVLIVLAALAALGPAADALAAAYQTETRLVGLSPAAFTAALGSGMLMGWAGAFAAVRMYLRRLDFGQAD